MNPKSTRGKKSRNSETAEAALDHLDSLDEAEYPPVPETRAIRYALQPAARAEKYEKDLRHIRDHGFNTLIVGAFRQGEALFPSESLARRRFPLHPAFRRRDPLAEVCDICRSLKLRLFAHVEVMNVGHQAGAMSSLLKKYPKWSMRRRPWLRELKGRDSRRYFLDPSNPDMRRLIGDICYELVERYPTRGFFLNDVRYPRELADPAMNQDVNDIERFVAEAKPETPWLAEVMLRDEPYGRALFEDLIRWRNRQLNETLRYIHCRLERGNPRVWIVSQALGPYLDEETPNSLQGDWVNWLSQQYVDGAAPYYKPVGLPEFKECLASDLARLPDDRAMYPMLSGAALEGAGGMLQAVQDHPVTGVVIRSFEELGEEHWSRLKTVFRRKAVAVEQRPSVSAGLALEEARRVLRHKPELVDLFTAILRVINEQSEEQGPLTVRSAVSIDRNLRAIEDRMCGGSLDLDKDERISLKWVSLARRCLTLTQRQKIQVFERD